MNKQDLEKLVNLNYSTYQIAKEFKCGQTSIRYWLKKFELKTNHKSIKDGEYPDRKKTISENGIVYTNCPVCKEKIELNKKNFYIKNDGRYHSWCKSCSNKKSIIRLRDIKVSCIKYKGGKCQVCNYNKYFGALEFHHLDPKQKDFTIASSNKSFELLKNELDKCTLLCSNCHGEVHAGIIILSTCNY
jgi:hypothetical protein